MIKLLIKESNSEQVVGSAPGTLQYIGANNQEKPQLENYVFSPDSFEEKQTEFFEGSFREKEGSVYWLNLKGIHQVELVRRIGKYFDLHVLTQEEIVNTEQRPKLEQFESYLFMPLKMVYPGSKEDSFIVEHISLVLGENFVLSFQEQSQDVFQPIRQRIKDPKSRLRERGADYFFYTLLDAIVSNYFGYVDRIEERISTLEEEIYSKTNSFQLKGW